MIKETLEGIANATIGLAGGVLLNACPYAIPTVIESSKNIKPPKRRTSLESMGYAMALTIGAVGLYAQEELYHNNPKYLLLPLATNLISASVELNLLNRIKKLVLPLP